MKREERNDLDKKKRLRDEDGEDEVLKQSKRVASNEKRDSGNPYSSIVLAKEVAETLHPWPYQYFRPINMCMTFCGFDPA